MSLIQDIISKAVYAPSGDNSQPWIFKVEDEQTLLVYMDPDADNPILNYKKGGTLISHGALIENIEITATEYGYSTHTILFPNNQDSNLVAKIKFEKEDNLVKNNLFDYIEKRHTNRKVYKKVPLPDDVINKLKNEVTRESVVFLTDKKDRVEVATAASFMEKIALNNKKIHNLFFEGIHFDKKKNLEGAKGLYIKTLELPPPIQLLFRVLNNWTFTKLLNKIGFSTLASRGNRQTYANSPLLLLFLADNTNAESFVEVGKTIQKLWLRCTSFGLSAQPMTGISFLTMMQQDSSLKKVISDKDFTLVKEANDILGHYSREKKVIFIMRVGFSEKETTYSRRKKPVVIV